MTSASAVIPVAPTILIAGVPKTGTTALFFKIMRSVDGVPYGLFEPYDHAELEENKNIDAAQLSKRWLVTKILLTDHEEKEFNIMRLPRVNYPSFDHYHKKIVIVRDPRDTLISFLLYMIVNSTKLPCEDRAGRFIALLKQKENRPDKVSVGQIVDLMNELNECDFIELFNRWLDFSLVYADARQDKFVLKYEQLIKDDFGALERYLGFSLTGSAEVADSLSRVVRTKATGNWRNWFLAEDVSRFLPLLGHYLSRFDYPDEWDLAQVPVIRKEHTSGYVERILAELYTNLRN